MPQGHFGSIKVEKVHELDCPALSERLVIHAARFVVQFDAHRKHLGMF
jgi:hypothetical protein